MTMLSFRVDGSDAEAAQSWSAQLGIDRSQLFREALGKHLLHLESERGCRALGREPAAAEEQSLDQIESWGPAGDWSDWSDAAR